MIKVLRMYYHFVTTNMVGSPVGMIWESGLIVNNTDLLRFLFMCSHDMIS